MMEVYLELVISHEPLPLLSIKISSRIHLIMLDIICCHSEMKAPSVVLDGL